MKIDENFFEYSLNFKILLMNNTIIEKNVGNINFKNLQKISHIRSNYFKICCLFWLYTKHSENFECFPKYSSFRTCSNLIDSNLKRFFYW